MERISIHSGVGTSGELADILIGEEHDEEPDLYLWGIRVSDDSFEPWDLLVAARDRFESNLPVDRPLTEPDIALHLPGKYLVLIEAKFTSPNGWYRQGVRQNDKSLTLEELLDIYSGEEVRLLNTDLAQQCERIPYQLWRNTVFADWMALQDSPQTKPYHVNLVREGYEHESQQAFATLLNEPYGDRFRPATWEAIYAWLAASSLLRSASALHGTEDGKSGEGAESLSEPALSVVGYPRDKRGTAPLLGESCQFSRCLRVLVLQTADGLIDHSPSMIILVVERHLRESSFVGLPRPPVLYGSSTLFSRCCAVHGQPAVRVVCQEPSWFVGGRLYQLPPH